MLATAAANDQYLHWLESAKGKAVRVLTGFVQVRAGLANWNAKSDVKPVIA
jgi:hypothetical protein